MAASNVPALSGAAACDDDPVGTFLNSATTASIVPMPQLLELPQPYLLFLGDVAVPANAKTAFGLRDWAGERCVGEFACAGAAVSTGLPFLSPAEARALGARALVIGIANAGGRIVESWVPAIVEALESGLDVISGMHAKLDDVPAIKAAAERCGRRLIDVRCPPRRFPTATGRKRSGLRLLTVGTDCALGKKYTALALTRAFRERGLAVDFRATGQTGMLIAGSGIPIDAVVCHEPGRQETLGLPGYALTSIEETMDLTLRHGRRTNPAIRSAGVALNTSRMGDVAARQLLADESERLRMPCADPMRGGAEFDRLVDACLLAVAS